MRLRFLSYLAIAVAAPAMLQAQSAQDFRLPAQPTPDPSTPSDVQGPVDTESGALPVRPRVIPTARPVAVPTPIPTVTPRPEATPVPLPTTPRPAPRSEPAASRRSTAQSAAAPAQAQPTNVPEPVAPPSPRAQADPIAPAPGEPAAPAVPAPTPSPSILSANDETAEQNDFAPWMLFLGLIALAVAAAVLFLRQRNARGPAVPMIDRPTVSPANARASVHDLRMDADALKLTRSMAFATLDYQVTLRNGATKAARDIGVSADLVTAHGNAPLDSQIASQATTLEPRHTFERIAPGQTVRHQGKLQIPLSEARVVRQGAASLIVPLLRVRIDGEGAEPIVRTYVVGQGMPGGGKVAPFRLDDGPRSYAPIAARAID